MNKIVYLTCLVLAIVLGFLIRGFILADNSPKTMEAPLVSVVAKELKEMPIDLLDNYIAKIEPVQEVMVHTEVAGYIDEVHFKEGSFVNEGDLLFTIDQKKYRAQVDARQADLARAMAERDRSEKYLKRMRETSHRSVSQSDVDTAESNNLQAIADLQQAEANLNLAEIDLDYSEIRSPISGRIGAAMITKGNYVTYASDYLARIVQVDPIRVVFSMTDSAYLNMRQKELNGCGNSLVAWVCLPNGSKLKMIGKKDFDDNAMNPDTGTIAVRYLFDNKDGLLVSGCYVNILIGQEEPPMGIRIPQKALLVDQQGNYVLTVNESGQVGAARVEVGKSIKTNVIVLSGLKDGDKIVIDGIQKVKPGMQASVTLQEDAK